jgi:hypothetical protein
VAVGDFIARLDAERGADRLRDGRLSLAGDHSGAPRASIAGEENPWDVKPVGCLVEPVVWSWTYAFTRRCAELLISWISGLSPSGRLRVARRTGGLFRCVQLPVPSNKFPAPSSKLPVPSLFTRCKLAVSLVGASFVRADDDAVALSCGGGAGRTHRALGVDRRDLEPAKFSAAVSCGSTKILVQIKNTAALLMKGAKWEKRET